MKKALILHATRGTSQDNWYPWLQEQLQANSYHVWTPDLPHAEKPNLDTYNQFLLSQTDFTFDQETILVGHSSGSVAILGLLQALPPETRVAASYLVGAFKDDLGWDALSELFLKPLDFEAIKTRSRLWYFIHSDNDPHCPLEGARSLHSQIGGDLIILPGQQHFSIGTGGDQYRQFPYLAHLILGDSTTVETALELYQDMEKAGVKLWLDGGWGVDALLGKQTRLHSDLDLVVQKHDVETLTNYLTNRGYWEIERQDSSEHNFMLSNDQAQLVDIHVIELDQVGNGLYGPKELGVSYPAETLTGSGKLQHVSVHCISPKGVLQFHTGYDVRASDRHDVLAVCKQFNLPIPQEYHDQ